MDPKPTGHPELPPSGWTLREKALLLALVAALAGLFVLRVQTRRPDPSRVPARLDVLVIHAAGLRADAAPAADLAADLGFTADAVLSFEEAFAPSGDVRRSLLSLLEGDVVLNLDAMAGPGSLGVAFADAGWTTALVAQGALPDGANVGFASRRSTPTLATVPDELTAALDAADRSKPVFALVHLAGPAEPLHATTTDSSQLAARYAALVSELRGTLSRLAVAAATRKRPGLVALVGASGMELGGHPEEPGAPWDSQLRVPMLIGLRGGDGLPTGSHQALVQTTDLAPTLLDLLDLRDRPTRDGDGTVRLGVSLEPLAHGWSRPPVHERLFFADRHHAAVRTRSWKLIAPVRHPWKPVTERAQLYSLDEDPQERFDLAAQRPLGPVGADLLQRLTAQLARPEADRSGE
jgi:hypothetical protein